MSTHNKRLRSGVKELVQIGGTTLEDLHMVATDVIATLDKLAARTLRKLKTGQSLRVYDEESNKEYGQKGSDLPCFFKEAYDTKVRGATLKVYDAKNEWSIGLDCLLEVFDEFDPESDEGKKRASKPGPKRRGRRPKAETADTDATDEFDTQWAAQTQELGFEPEVDDEEYDFTNSTNWEDFFEND
jgi:hypothetical protein